MPRLRFQPHPPIQSGPHLIQLVFVQFEEGFAQPRIYDTKYDIRIFPEARRVVTFHASHKLKEQIQGDAPEAA